MELVGGALERGAGRTLRGALAAEGLHADAVQLLPSADRASVTHLIQARGLVDVVIPRGERA